MDRNTSSMSTTYICTYVKSQMQTELSVIFVYLQFVNGFDHLSTILSLLASICVCITEYMCVCLSRLDGQSNENECGTFDTRSISFCVRICPHYCQNRHWLERVNILCHGNCSTSLALYLFLSVPCLARHQNHNKTLQK